MWGGTDVLAWDDCGTGRTNVTPGGSADPANSRSRALALWEAELWQREQRLKGSNESSVASPLKNSGSTVRFDEAARQLELLVKQTRGAGCCQAAETLQQLGAELRACIELASSEAAAARAARKGEEEVARALAASVANRERRVSAQEERADAREELLSRREQALAEREERLAARESAAQGRSQPAAAPERRRPAGLLPAAVAAEAQRSDSQQQQSSSPKYTEGRTLQDPTQVLSYVEDLSDSGSEAQRTPPRAGVVSDEGVVGFERWQELLAAARADAADSEDEEDEEEEEECDGAEDPEHEMRKQSMRRMKSWRRRFSQAGESQLSDEEFGEFFDHYGDSDNIEEATLQYVMAQLEQQLPPGVDPEQVLAALMEQAGYGG